MQIDAFFVNLQTAVYARLRLRFQALSAPGSKLLPGVSRGLDPAPLERGAYTLQSHQSLEPRI